MTIGAAADLTRLGIHTIRYYEAEGLLLWPLARNAAGRRIFGAEDIDWLRTCGVLRATGVTMVELRDLAALVRAGSGNERQRAAILRRRLNELHSLRRVIDEDAAVLRRVIEQYADVVARQEGGDATLT